VFENLKLSTKIIVLFTLFLVSPFNTDIVVAAAQVNPKEPTENVTSERSNTIKYWENDIDVLNVDPAWDQIKEQTLKESVNSKQENQAGEIRVEYKMAYSSRYFYLMLIAHTDKTVSRDNGFRHGDGFSFVFALPKNSEGETSTDEFYELAFWNAGQKEDKILADKMMLYPEEVTFNQLPKSYFSILKSENKVVYQVAVAWKDIPPFKPYHMKNFGINMRFVQAVGRDDKIYYYLLKDDNLGTEYCLRQYRPFVFEDKINLSKTDVVQNLVDHLLVDEGKSLFNIAFNSFEPTDFMIRTNINTKIQERKISTEKGISIKDLELSPALFQNGMNTISIDISKSGEVISSAGYKILKLDRKEISGMQNELTELKMDKSSDKADLNTLEFYMEDFLESIKNFKRYSSPVGLSEKKQAVFSLINTFKTERRILRTGNGTVIRRAFKSGYDQTLQPYSLRFPKDFAVDKECPLIVFLHGSGCDDRWLSYASKNFYKLADSCRAVILTPKGRGVSDCYTKGPANIDVIEALKDVFSVCPVRKSDVILAGFSMGGYGVYRIAYEFPDLFSAFLVVSGDPSMGRKWLGEQYPDFLQDAYLKKLPKRPFFIFHSREDRNCPYKNTEEFAAKLKVVNPDVAFEIDEKNGHSAPDDAKTDRMVEWVKKQFNRENVVSIQIPASSSTLELVFVPEMVPLPGENEIETGDDMSSAREDFRKAWHALRNTIASETSAAMVKQISRWAPEKQTNFSFPDGIEKLPMHPLGVIKASDLLVFGQRIEEGLVLPSNSPIVFRRFLIRAFFDRHARCITKVQLTIKGWREE